VILLPDGKMVCSSGITVFIALLDMHRLVDRGWPLFRANAQRTGARPAP
jgi:hypothetical protein